jgi:hypothetical protein
MRRVIIAGAAVLILGMLLGAATLERLSLEEMAQKSTAVVRGRVTDSYAAVHGSTIYTHYRVQVTDTWKGAGGTTLDVVVPGGVAGGLRQTFSGAPQLVAGHEYLLFLWTSRSGLTHITGYSQGVFSIRRDDTGDVALRNATTELMLDSAGKPVRDEAVTLKLRDLRQRVASGLRGQQ